MISLTPALRTAQEHAAEGPASPFEVNFGLFFWTWVVFIALFFALKKFAWPAILKATEERERRIKAQLEDAERMNTEAKAALEEHRQLLAGARDEVRTVLNEAKTVAQKEREALLARTRQEQEQMLDRAKREIDAERERAVTELRREAVDLSLAAASKLIEERLDNDANRRLVTEFLGSLGKGH
ncbi:MAG TPA: F0F1 ATP synthase subunit B [Gemmatimonadales bacterium]